LHQPLARLASARARPYTNEALLGEALAPHRDRVVIATKFVPIPGTTKLSRFEENIGAAEVGLTAQDLAKIERAAAQIDVQGARYPAHLQALVGR